MALRDNTSERFNRFRIKSTISFILMAIAMTAVLSALVITVSSNIISRKVSSLIAANSRQISLNVDTYMNKFVTAGTLLFANDDIYGFDITDSSLDEYEISKSKTAIENRIIDIGIMENFSDFAILYSNDKSVGWLSNITQDLFLDGSNKYETFTTYIDNADGGSAWVYGVKDNTSRVYYVKRMNKNAILVESFFSRELSKAFEISEQLEGMTVRLIDGSDRIVYSSDRDEIGSMLTDDIEKLIADSSNISIYNKEIFVNVDSCSNSWRIVCEIPENVILAENNRLRGSILIIAVIIILLAIAFIGLAQEKLAKPITGEVSGLEKKASYDALSGVLNKNSFTENVTSALGGYSGKTGAVTALVMMDMDNFKRINDTLGHAYGDQVIKRMGTLLDNIFGEKALIGRLGGDEFAMFMSYSVLKTKMVEGTVKADMDKLRKEFGLEFAKEQKECSVSLSCGIHITNYREGISFEEIYKKSDKALYVSKQSGKDRYTFYTEDMGI